MKLVQFKKEIQLGQEDTATRALKRAHSEKPYIFWKCCNEEQAVFNSKVDEALEKAESDLAPDAASPALASAV